MSEVVIGSLEDLIRIQRGEILRTEYNYVSRTGVVLWKRDLTAVGLPIEYVVHRFTTFPASLIQGNYFPDYEDSDAYQSALAAYNERRQTI